MPSQFPSTVFLPRILAIETSGHSGSVAVGLGGEMLVERMLPGDRRTARMLAPAIRDVLAQAGWKPDSVTLVTVAIGPGSFTGLRLGVTTAKAFAYAIGCDIVGLDTREILAGAIPARPSMVHTVLDAQRGEYFVGTFQLDEARPFWRLREGPVLRTEAEFLAALRPGDVVTGPVLTKLASQLPPGVRAADRELWQPQARVMLGLAARDAQAGRRDDVFKLLPEYHRASAAEEKRAQTAG
jgi:tRNA threonylcarbamoyladenosine biosynthesis protein TsaB